MGGAYRRGTKTSSHSPRNQTLSISLRTKEALAAARAAGKRLGRPPGRLGHSKLDGKEADIRRLLGLHVSKASIAKITGVDRSTLYHFMRSRHL